MSDSVRPHKRQPTRLPVPGILQARTLEWVAISFSSAWKWKGKVKSLSHVWLLATPWTAAYQAPLSMGFSRQEYWSGVPLPSPLKGTNYFFYFAVPICCCYLAAKLCLTLVTLPTVALQAPLSMGFPRQEYWSGLPFPSPIKTIQSVKLYSTSTFREGGNYLHVH